MSPRTIHLTQINVDESVEDILREICEGNKIQYEMGKFALKVKDPWEVKGTEYITDENKHRLRHGRQLKLSQSPGERAASLIESLYASENAVESTVCLRNLASASRDAILARELHRQDAVHHMRTIASLRELSLEEYYRHYKTMAQFLARGHLGELLEDEVNQLIDFVVEDGQVTVPMLLLSFDIFIKLRMMGKLRWPSEHLRHLASYLRLYGKPKLQERCLQFINSLYLYSADPREREGIGNFMRSSLMMAYINKYVIREHLTDGMKHQLYLYQKVILRKYSARLCGIDASEEEILETLERAMLNVRSAAEGSDRCRRSSDRDASRSLRTIERRRTVSESSSAGDDGKLRERLLSQGSEDVFGAELSRSLSAASSDISFIDGDTSDDGMTRCEGDDDDDDDDPRVGQSEDVTFLVRDNIYYFVANDCSGFNGLLRDHEENLRSVLRLGVSVTNLLCKVLEIRKEEPIVKTGRFIPLCFLYLDQVLERIFCIAFKLFHETRKEMKVTVDSEEYPLVLRTVEEQLVMALEKEPMEFMELEMRLRDINVDAIAREREETVRNGLVRQLTEEPGFVELKEMVTPRILDTVKEKRLRFMERGEHVQQFDYRGLRVTGKKWFVSIPKTRDNVVIEECSDDPCRNRHRTLETVPVTDILEVECGSKSNFYKEVHYNLYNERDMFFRSALKQNVPEIEFPISLKLRSSNYVDFCAGTETNMDHWTDGLNALMGLKMGSNAMKEEFEYLLDIELMSHLADLEGVVLPSEPPAVPPPPPDYDFSLP